MQGFLRIIIFEKLVKSFSYEIPLHKQKENRIIPFKNNLPKETFLARAIELLI